MNEEQKQEFFEWYQTMKDRIREISNDPELRPEYKLILVQSTTEPIGIWRDRRQRPGQTKLPQDQPQSSSNPVKNETKPPSTEQPKNQPAQQKLDPLSEILKKYSYNLHRINEGKIEINPRFKDSETYHKVSDELFKIKWKRAKGEDAFVKMEEGAKA
jgi:hypothetical protein